MVGERKASNIPSYMTGEYDPEEQKQRLMSKYYDIHNGVFLFKKKLSILIPTLHQRKDVFSDLKRRLEDQIIKYGLTNDVEIKHRIDGGQMPIGYKRNELMYMANGEYVMFIDDDDEVADDHLYHIMEGITKGHDCVTFNGKITFNGENEKDIIFSLKNTNYSEVDGTRYWPPTHLCAMKQEVAIFNPFVVIKGGKTRQERMDNGTDVTFTLDIVKQGLLKNEYHIDKKLYHYKYSSKDE